MFVVSITDLTGPTTSVLGVYDNEALALGMLKLSFPGELSQTANANGVTEWWLWVNQFVGAVTVDRTPFAARPPEMEPLTVE